MTASRVANSRLPPTGMEGPSALKEPQVWHKAVTDDPDCHRVLVPGRFTGVKGPGRIILIPVIQQLVKVDLRVVAQVVPPQDVISEGSLTLETAS